MDENVELLNYIHQNSEMGKDTIKQLFGVVEDEEFKKMLASHFEEYKSIYDTTDRKIRGFNKEAKDVDIISKASTHVMINIKTLRNKTASHISEMLINGSTMGIIDITKRIKEYPNADEEILGVANRLLELEQNNEDYKKYLQ